MKFALERLIWIILLIIYVKVFLTAENVWLKSLTVAAALICVFELRKIYDHNQKTKQ